LRAASRSNIIMSAIKTANSWCRASFSLALKHGIYRECENSVANLTNSIFEEFWPVLSDRKPADRKNSC